MGFEPEELAPDASPAIAVAAEDSAEDFAGPWRTIYRHPCAFGPDVFAGVMANLIKNPNINSTWLFRADILHDDSSGPPLPPPGPPGPGAPRRAPVFTGFELRRHMVRRLIPRNTLRDKPRPV
jgi:tRNASer (uridine44-2'-O)-methyltransferase